MTADDVFGTDYPWGTPATMTRSWHRSGLTVPELQAIERENALNMWPSLRS